MQKKVYFASDLHLGAPNTAASLIREKQFVRWLTSIEDSIDTLYLVGDVFDFWFEYEKAVPRGYVRLLGKLAELSDKGIPIHVFIGNHDLWYTDYIEKEIGVQLHHKPFTTTHFGKKIYIAHGDGLGPGDYKYKFIRSIFVHPFSKWLYARLHPNTGIRIAEFLSKTSGNYTKKEGGAVYYGEKEMIVIHSREMLKQETDISYFIYGHRHILKEIPLTETAKCLYLGDWIRYNSYAVMDEDGIHLAQFT